MSVPVSAASKTGRQSLLFVAASVWVAVSLTGGRLAAAPVPAVYADLVQQAVVAILLFGGFYLLARTALPDLRPLSGIGFVRRLGAAQEFGIGTALGWGIGVALVLPALLTGNFHASLAWDMPSLLLLVKSAAVLALFTIGTQLIISGLPARLLLRIASPGWTAAATCFAGALSVVAGQRQPGRNLLFAAIAAGLFSAAFLRTRAAWLPLGLQLGWMLSLQLLFGAASPYTPPVSSVVQSQIGGTPALTGGVFGPEASGFAIVVVLLAFVVLFRATRDYAWHYTYQPLVGAGYPVEVAPPVEHLREEQRVAAAAPLVQIAGFTTPPASAPPSSVP